MVNLRKNYAPFAFKMYCRVLKCICQLNLNDQTDIPLLDIVNEELLTKENCVRRNLMMWEMSLNVNTKRVIIWH